MLSFHDSNKDPSLSCVANSGLRREKTFAKGDGHQRKLCSVEPQLQQRPLCCIQAWRRASAVSSGVHRDMFVLIMWLVTGAYDVVIFVIEGPEAVVDPEGVPARVCM